MGWHWLPVPAIAAGLLASCARTIPYDEAVAGLPDGRFVEVAGRRAYVDDAGSGPAIVLLHGFASSSFSFRDVIPRLAERHRVIVPDLNGFGWTERTPDPAAYTPAGQAALVFAVLDAKNIPAAHVVGHSYGGTLALYLAERHPERVLSVTAADAPSAFGPPWRVMRHPASTAVLHPLAHWFISSPAAFNHGLGVAYHQEDMPERDMSEEYRRRLLVDGFQWAFPALSAIDGSAPEHAVDPSGIARPALVLWGARDGIVRPSRGRKLAASIPAARFTLVKDAGHALPEEAPEAFSDAVLEFVGSVDRAATRRGPPLALGDVD